MTATSAKELLSSAFTALLVLCALTITGLIVRREFFPPQAPLETSYYGDWESLTDVGHHLGDTNAAVQMVVFFDYQCPFCRQVQPTIEQLMVKYPDQLAVTHRHFLLTTIHPQARSAALAAECAAEQGRFEPMHQLLFENASQLGQKPWEELASEAGVSDIESFKGCLAESRYMDRIVRDQTAVSLLGVRAIPALVINGTVLTGAKSFEVLDELVQDALSKAQ